MHQLLKPRPNPLWRIGQFDWRTGLAFGLPLALYLATLAPTIYNLDSAEFSTAAATGGLIRATGYPLYLIVGGLWSYLPFGDVGYRLNLLSAVCGALTIALADRILRRWSVGPVAAGGALGLLACSPYFWGLSLIAEVYTMHTALMALILLWLLRWRDQPTPSRLALLSVTIGLSLGHHVATVLLIPGCIWFLITTAPRPLLHPKTIASGLLAGCLGLSIYLYIPLRFSMQPAFNYAGHYDASGNFVPVDLQTVSGLWWLISGQAFAGRMFGYATWEAYTQQLQLYGIQLWQSFFGLGIGPGLLGLILMMRRDWRLGSSLGLMFAGNAIFYIGYDVVDKKTMFLPTYLIWALWIGWGYQALLRWFQEDEVANSSPGYWQKWLVQSMMIGAVLLVMAWNWRLVDLSADWTTRQRAETTLRQVEPQALILGWWDTAPALQYLQLVEGQRPDVIIINRFLIDHHLMRQLIAQEIQQRPVYIDDVPADFFNWLQIEDAGMLYRLRLD